MSGTTIKMAPNVPMPVRIKYIDVWPNDTTKNNGKGYGPSLSLKDDAGDRIYPKGFTDRNIATLMAAGVIAEGYYDVDPVEKYSIPVVNGNVTLCLEQTASDKYPTFTVKASGDVKTPTNGKPPIASALPKNAKPIAPQLPDPPKKNPNAKTVPGGIEGQGDSYRDTPLDDKEFADSLVNGAEEASQAADLEAHTTETPFDQLVEKYRACVAAATEIWGNDMSGEASVAAAATLFIARNQRGI